MLSCFQLHFMHLNGRFIGKAQATPMLKSRMFPINVNKQHYQSPKMAPRDYWLNSLYCELCAVDHIED